MNIYILFVVLMGIRLHAMNNNFCTFDITETLPSAAINKVISQYNEVHLESESHDLENKWKKYEKNWKAFTHALTFNSTVTALDVADNNLTTKQLDLLLDTLHKNKTITTLNISDNAISRFGVIKTIRTLKKGKKISSINVGRQNPIKSSKKRKYNIGKELASTMHNYFHLEKIFLSKVGLTTKEAIEIAKAIAYMTTKYGYSLSTAYFDSNKIGNPGAQAFGQALKTNDTLKKLNLSRNPFDDEAASALAEGLTQNQTLTWLGLMCRDISPEGENALIKALKKNRTLSSLKMHHRGQGRSKLRSKRSEYLHRNQMLGKRLLDYCTLK